MSVLGAAVDCAHVGHVVVATGVVSGAEQEEVLKASASDAPVLLSASVSFHVRSRTKRARGYSDDLKTAQKKGLC